MLLVKGAESPWELAAISKVDEVLGLGLVKLTQANLRIRPKEAQITKEEIVVKLNDRKEARSAKDFDTSDRIRDDLIANGVDVMDGNPLGWDWKLRI
jgi:cysteinyl-tRNA synthetase